MTEKRLGTSFQKNPAEMPGAEQPKDMDFSHWEKRAEMIRLLKDKYRLIYDDQYGETTKYLEFLPDADTRDKAMVMEKQKRLEWIIAHVEAQLRQTQITELESQVQQLTYDSVMELKVRAFFFKQLEEKVKSEVLGKQGLEAKGVEKMSFDEFAQAFQNLDGKDVPLSVMMSDVSFLSLANQDSHDTGDQLLKKIGQTAKEFMQIQKGMEFFRHGGDEVTAILTATPKQALAQAQAFKSKVQETPAGKYLDNLNLKLNVDVGVCDIGESLKAFNQLMQALQAEQLEIPSGKRLKTFLNFWLDIADRKAIAEKAMERIKMLIFYRKELPDVYEVIVDPLRKGALRIKDEQLDQIIASTSDQDERIKIFVLSQMEQEIKDDKRLDQLKTQLAYEVATKDIRKQLESSHS